MAEDVRQGYVSVRAAKELSARTSTRTIPDGVYEAESFMDDDGVDTGK